MIDIYWAQFRNTLVTQFQYRAALLIWMIGLVLEPLIYLVVWSTVARSAGGSVGGYGPREFAAYYLVLMLVEHVTFTWIVWHFDYLVRQGQLSPLLLRPLHPIHSHVAENVSYKLLTTAVLIPTAAALVWIFRPVFQTEPWHVLAWLPALGFAFLLRFILEWTVGMLAFWVTRMGAINQAYYFLLMFLSGFVTPLSLLPAPVVLVATVLPFRWMVAFPVELLLGRLSVRETLLGFGAQAAWLLVIWLLYRLVWRVGIRHYSAVGA